MSYLPEQSSSATPSFFPKTSWTLLHDMGTGDTTARKEAWREFFHLYFSCLVSALRQRGADHQMAEDVVQNTFLRIWQNPGLPDRLGTSGGRLRSYLLNAVVNNHRETIRKSGRLKRGGSGTDASLDEREDEVGREDRLAYDSDWAIRTTRLVLANLREEYVARGRAGIFDQGIAFLDSRDPSLRERLADELGLAPNTLTVALKRLRERLAERLREFVASTLYQPTPEAIDDELRHLMASLPAGLDLKTLAGDLSHSGGNDITSET